MRNPFEKERKSQRSKPRRPMQAAFLMLNQLPQRPPL